MEQVGSVEKWLRAEFGVPSDFEVDDALNGLAEKGLLARDAEVLRVYDLPSALRRLDATWDEFFGYDGTRLPSADRLADWNWPPMESREIAPGVGVRRADMPHGPAATGGGGADAKADIPRRRSVIAPFSGRPKV